MLLLDVLTKYVGCFFVCYYVLGLFSFCYDRLFNYTCITNFCYFSNAFFLYGLFSALHLKKENYYICKLIF